MYHQATICVPIDVHVPTYENHC